MKRLATLIAIIFLLNGVTMARGRPDYGSQQYQTAQTAYDTAEVYNRLEWFSTPDNRGRVLYMDYFYEGLSGWSTGSTGAGIPPTLDSGGISFRPPHSIILAPGVVNGDQSSISRAYNLGQSAVLGIESVWYMPLASSATMEERITYRLLATQFRARLFYLPNTAQWFVTTNSGDVLVTAAINANGTLAHAKVVADFNAGVYKRVIIGENQYDNVNGLSLFQPGGGSVGVMVADVIANSRGGGTTPARCGLVVITKDEPP